MTTPHTADQLDLFGSGALRSAVAENVWLRERLDLARVEYRNLRAERDRLAYRVANYQDMLASLQLLHDETLRALDAAQREATLWKFQVETWRRLAQLEASTPPPGAPDPLLKRLLALAHPDKWSQGQPATALAHEITIALNAARGSTKGAGL